jgi:hypothetical protein
MRRQCANATCSQTASSMYCSRRCQLATRNVGHRVGLPDIRVGMDTERALIRRAQTLDITVRDLIVNLLEAEVGDVVGWDHLDFGDVA